MSSSLRSATLRDTPRQVYLVRWSVAPAQEAPVSCHGPVSYRSLFRRVHRQAEKTDQSKELKELKALKELKERGRMLR